MVSQIQPEKTEKQKALAVAGGSNITAAAKTAVRTMPSFNLRSIDFFCFSIVSFPLTDRLPGAGTRGA